MPLTTLSPMLCVTDLEHSLAFYCDRLGFNVTNDFVVGNVRTWANIERDGVSLMLTQHGVSQEPAAAIGHADLILYFHADDVLTLAQELRGNGVEVVGPRVTGYQMKEIALEDPNGYRLWFGQDTDEPPTSDS